MHVKSIISALALSAALAVSGAAYAQTLNGAEISADDLAAVTERCAMLVMAETSEKTTGDATTGAQATDSETPDATGSENETTPTDTPVANELEAATSTIDLDTITIEQCTEAGLPAPAM